MPRLPRAGTALGTWLAQARGIFEATRAAHHRPAALGKAAAAWLAIQTLVLVILLLVASVAGPVVPPAATYALVAVTLFLALAGNFGVVVGAEADLIKEAEQAVLDTLHVSPLPGSAYLAGKLAHALSAQAFHLACLLPSFSLCYLLGALDASGVARAAVVLLAATALFVTGFCGRAHRLHAARRTGRRGPGLGSKAAGGYVAATFMTLFVAMGLSGLSGVGSGGGEAPFLALTSILPAVGLASIATPVFSISLFGHAVPLWATGIAVSLALLPIAVADARRRWKPPSRSRGSDLRLGLLLAAMAATALLAGTTRKSSEYPWAMVVFTGILLAVVPAWGSASELSDAARGHDARASSAVLSMRRDTAALHACVVLGACLFAFALFAPAGCPEAWPLAAVLAAGGIPAACAIAGVGRLLPPGRVSAIALAAVGLFVAGSLVLLPTIAKDMVDGAGAGESAAERVESAVAFVGAASPIATLLALADRAVPGAGFADPDAAVFRPWPVGLALQGLVAVATWWIARRRGERDARRALAAGGAPAA